MPLKALLRRRFRRLTVQAQKILIGRRVEPLWRHCLLAFPLATIPSFVLVLLGAAVIRAFGQPLPEVPIELELGVWGVMGTVLLTPLIETFLLAVGLVVFNAITRRAVFAAALSAVFWGGLHGLIAPFWFLGSVWGFYVLSICYLAWWPRSFGRGYTAALVPHVLNNGLVILVVAVERLG